LPEAFVPIDPNPYIVGNPIRNRDMFFGREEELRYLRDRLDTDGQETVVLCGGRRSGKTSILLQVLDGRLGERFLPVLVDMQQLAELRGDDDFWRTVAVRIHRRLGEAGIDLSGLPDPREADGVPDGGLRELLEAARGRLGRRKVVVLVDEYELIEELVHQGVLTHETTLRMSSLLDAGLPLSFIFTGSRRIQERDPVVWSRLMGRALHRRISFLSLGDAERLVRTPVAGKVRHTEEAVAAILRLTAGHPFYTQVVCQALVDRLNERRSAECGPEDVDAVAETIGDNPLPQMVYWWKSMPLLERVLASLLAAKAEATDSFVPADSLEDDLRIHRAEYGFRARRASIRGSLERLVENEDLEPGECRDEFRFRMDLLRRWIRVEHPVWETIRDLATPATDLGGIQPLGGGIGLRAGIAAAVLVVLSAGGVAAWWAFGGENAAGAGATGGESVGSGTSSADGNADPDARIASSVDGAAGGGDGAAAGEGFAGVVIEAGEAGGEPLLERYARDFTLRRQVPVPLGEIAPDDRPGRTGWCTFRYQGDRLVRFEYRNGSDFPMPLPWEELELPWWPRATTLVPEYRADGSIERMTVFRCAEDETACVPLAVYVYSADLTTMRVVLPGRETPTWDQQGISIWEYELDDAGAATEVRFRNVLGKPHADSLDRVALRFVRDDGGWVREVHETLRLGARGSGADEAAAVEPLRIRRIGRDERHNASSVAMFDEEGRPLRFAEIAEWGGAHRVTLAHDDRDRVVEARRFTVSGDPAPESGIAAWRTEYDELGNRVRIVNLGGDGKPAPDTDGVTVTEWRHDVRGLPTLQRVLARSGLPADETVRQAWDERGNLVRETFVDETILDEGGEPLVVRVRAYDYDESGRRTALHVLDAEGRPAAPQAFATIRYVYDEHEALREKRYEGLDGKPTEPTRGDFRGVHRLEVDYDAWGFVVAERYLDAEGNPTSGSADVFAVAEWERDPAGRPLSVRMTDAEGNPVGNPTWPNAAKVAFRYDADGNITEERAHDADGKPVPGATRQFVIRREYDRLGRVRVERYLDAEGGPMVGGYYGVGRVERLYAELAAGGTCGPDERAALLCAGLDPPIEGIDRGTVVETRFFDPSGAVAASAVYGPGIARVVSVVDGRNELLELRYFDRDGRPAANRQRVHILRRRLGEFGPLEELTIGLDGLPMEVDGGDGTRVARRVWRYDDLGHEVEFRLFGSAGNPCGDGDGIAARVRRYEEDRIVEEQFLDAAGALHPTFDGPARIVWEYGAGDRVTRESHLDAEGLAAAPADWTADLRVTYDERGAPVRFEFAPPLAVGPAATAVHAAEIRYQGPTALAVPVGEDGARLTIDGVLALRHPRAEWGDPTGCLGGGGATAPCPRGMELLLRLLMAPRQVTCPPGVGSPGESRCAWM
jgi:hypothetical protein